MKATSIFLCIVVIVGTYEVHGVSSSAVSARNSLEILKFRRHYKDPKKAVFACEVLKYRTFNGLCNNLFGITRGSAGRPLQRILNATYEGGLDLQAPRSKSVTGYPLPNARNVSNIALQNSDTADRDGKPVNFSHLTMTFGQFLDHDCTLTELTPNVSCGINNATCNANPDCVNIKISDGQQLLYNQSAKCIPLARSRRDKSTGDQINLLTSYLDASQVYGSSKEVASRLRSPIGYGLLNVVPLINVGGRPRLPDADKDAYCRSPDPENKPCFKAGDIRVNENQALSAMQTLWMREHNRIATIMKFLNPEWNDETLFQEARRIVIAELQHITYNEWLPVLFDKDLREKFGVLLSPKGTFFTGYNFTVNPECTNAYSTAAFRMGHSLIRHTFTLRSGDGFFSRIRGSDPSLPEPIRFEPLVDFFEPSRFYNIKEQSVFSRILVGLSFINARAPDRFFVSNIHEKLINPGNIVGDLAAINIQRGRDHGLPSYTAFREALGLGKVERFQDLLGNFSQEQLDRFMAAGYRSVKDLDLFAAGITELPMPGSQLGSVFTSIILDQFRRIREGDRFWYERDDPMIGFSLPQLDEIRKVTMARLLCDNLDGVTRITKWVFRAHKVPNRCKRVGKVVDCAQIPYLNLKEFRRASGEEPAREPVAA